MLVNLPSPILELQHAPLPPKVLQVKECAPNSVFFQCVHFRLIFESIKELGSASMRILGQYLISLCWQIFVWLL
jgi:hypothetical protein